MGSTLRPRIIVADDSEDFQRTITRSIHLATGSAQVVAAHDIPESLKAIRDERPDLLVLDLHLLNSSGIEVLRAFPKASRKFPVLVVTGDRTPEVFNEAKTWGADDFVTKPVDYLVFQSKLQSLLHRRYVSAFPFFGTGRVLAGISLGFNIQIELLTDTLIGFRTPVLIEKGAAVSMRIGEYAYEAFIEKTIPAANPDGRHLLLARFASDLPLFEQLALRRAILRMRQKI